MCCLAARMSQRGWLSWSESARRERDLRSYSVAPAASSSWVVEPSSGALGPPALSVSLEDHRDGRRREESLRSRSGCAPRRLAPRTWPPSLAATSAGEIVGRAIDTRRSGPVGSDRPLSDATRDSTKTSPERVRSAAALFRPLRSSRLVIQLIVHWRGDRPSRRRHREHRPRRGRFPRREAGATS